MGSTHKGKNLLHKEQILSFKSRLHFGRALLPMEPNRKSQNSFFSAGKCVCWGGGGRLQMGSNKNSCFSLQENVCGGGEGGGGRRGRIANGMGLQ